MYMVPHIKPAPSAAAMPNAALPGGPPADGPVVAYARTQAPTTIASEPPSTLTSCARPALRSSLNRSHPQNSPTRLLVFHNGKAMESPTLRIANTVRVLATAHNI